jgi:hypothetical protein
LEAPASDLPSLLTALLSQLSCADATAKFRDSAKATNRIRLICLSFFRKEPARRLGLETVRYLAAALGKLRHDLLLQPDVHFRRTIESARIAKFLRQLLAGPRPLSSFSSFIKSTIELFQS